MMRGNPGPSLHSAPEPSTALQVNMYTKYATISLGFYARQQELL